MMVTTLAMPLLKPWIFLSDSWHFFCDALNSITVRSLNFCHMAIKIETLYLKTSLFFSGLLLMVYTMGNSCLPNLCPLITSFDFYSNYEAWAFMYQGTFFERRKKFVYRNPSCNTLYFQTSNQGWVMSLLSMFDTHGLNLTSL